MSKKRDASVQLIRVIACIIVVLVHSRPFSYTSMGYSFGRVLFSCLVADGVSIFLIITGFFFLKSNSFANVMKKGAVKVALPATLLMVVCVLLSGWLEGKTTIVESLMQVKAADFLNILKAWISGDASVVTNCGHLWYVFMHMFVLLWFPLLKRFQSDEKKIRYEKWAIMLIGVVYVIFNTWSDRLEWFQLANVGQYKVIPAAVLLVLIGDEIYRNVDRIKGNWIARVTSIVIFVVCNVVRTYDQLYEYELTNVDTVDRWDSLYGIICSTALVVFVISFKVKDNWFGKAVVYLAQFTFPIYLFHYVIICTLHNYTDSIQYTINNYFDAKEGTVIQYLCSVFANALLVLIMSLILSMVVHYLKMLIVNTYHRLGKNNNGSKV